MSSWIDHAARMRAERDDFARRAADRRRDAIELRKQSRFLDALIADSRASEYRKSRDDRAVELKRVAPFVSHEKASRDAQRRLASTREPQTLKQEKTANIGVSSQSERKSQDTLK